jgi:polysaccharide pyruvyl transferase WcaK-like protein
MRILIATGLNAGDAEYRNVGDVAMLQAAVHRLHNLWPDASLEVLTDSAADLAKHCPDAKALSRAACISLVGPKAILGRLHASVPKPVSAAMSKFQQLLDAAIPRALEWAVSRRLANHDVHLHGDFLAFTRVLRNADLLVVCGAGGFADSCQEWSLTTLGTMAAAGRRGLPVVMFGQGVGPLSDPVVLSMARLVLPKAKLIALRGTEGGAQLLNSLGVKADCVETTGDDAIELAYQSRASQPGDAIGLNLRIAFYAGVDPAKMQEVRSAVQAFARRNSASLLPVPIALHGVANDPATIRQLLSGFDDKSDGGCSLNTPALVMKQISRCRIVVTGAYHAAVFALSEGIPAICLANSAYYRQKFKGLRTSFGRGCIIVDLSDKAASVILAKAIEETWNSADTLRPDLLNAATRQIEKGRTAYQRVKRMLEAIDGEEQKIASHLEPDLTTTR